MSNSQSYSAIWLHYIWTTKYREPVIIDDIKYKIYDSIRAAAINHGIHLDFINGVADHIHCLVSLRTTQRPCDVAQHLKGGSSRWINETQLICGGFDWQDGYAALSVSPTNVQKVRNYIRNQEIHHARQSFDDELHRLKAYAVID